MDNVLLIAEKHFGEALKDLISSKIAVTHLTYEEWKKKGFISKLLILIRYKYIHHFGGTNSTTLINSCYLLRKKLIIHFTGTDVYNILHFNERNRSKIKALYRKVWKLAAVGIHLVAELKSVGIENVEHIPYNANIKMPEGVNQTPENSAVVYLPAGKEDFYGWNVIKELICSYPDITFYILGNSGVEEFGKDNALFLGWVDNVDDYIDKSKVYLRHTVHDGVPIFILRSLAYGRTVLFNHDFPHCRKFNKNEFENAIKNWSYNKEGREFIKKEYSTDLILRKTISLYGKP
jgi:hypothetical protein